MINMDWLLSNPNRAAIQKVIDKRAQLIADITINNVYIQNYQRKLTRYSRQIERLYHQGLRKVQHG